ncbi:MAG: gliding motility-associated C-terminal domain-containing protein [Bacteroidales bacterium]|nr:gliding motility-associated C-terminal domain-containing protein [Bacteroidales bacterium]
MKKVLLSLLSVTICLVSWATHERAGEIIYRHIADLTYEITLITYTYAPSPADRPELEIKWGDGTSAIVPRNNYVDLTPYIRRNIYIGLHTYTGPATYKISLEDPNRNYGIINIPNSVNIPFYIETELVINPFLGNNNSVVLLNPPLDYGCVNRVYIHNPGTYDPDGDSLSYKLVECRGANGLPIPGFEFPQASTLFAIDPYTGDIIWDSPELQGEYNVAFIIEEWRKGQRIGYVTRDLQIKIIACANYPPEIETIDDTCVEAGDYLKFSVTASDPDGDNVVLSATGSPFQVTDSPAQFQLLETDSALFSWNTNCSHVQKNPHPTYFKATDNNDTLNLTSYKTVNITVVAPAPENPEAVPLGNTIRLSWDKSICVNAFGYRIYRKNEYYGFFPGHCETGVPAYTGYSLIAITENVNDTALVDDDNGAGLIHGIEYCYMVTAYFQDGAESYASEEVCASLRKDVPIITNVSVETTGGDDGNMYIAWSKPTELDFSQTPGPFIYKLVRQSNESGQNEEVIAQYSDLNDTLFIDTGLNTATQGYTYRVDFYNNTPGDFFKIGSTRTASSPFLSVFETDRKLILNWQDNVPWKNDIYEIYRFEPDSNKYLLYDTTYQLFYQDTGLVNGLEYCYIIRTVGDYSTPGLVSPIYNFSQENCGTPVDNVPPCAPALTVETNCDMYNNLLSWTYPDTCRQEDLTYYIYYSETENGEMTLHDSTVLNTYIFETSPPSIVGCFTVTALDSLWNESPPGNTECVSLDACGRYRLPNVFTPNGDYVNDLFMPFPPKEVPFLDPPFPINSVEKIKISIFNRWGSVVFETDDPYVLWDGKDQTNGQPCSEGVYYFVCDVFEKTLTGTMMRTLKGSVTLLR